MKEELLAYWCYPCAEIYRLWGGRERSKSDAYATWVACVVWQHGSWIHDTNHRSGQQKDVQLVLVNLGTLHAVKRGSTWVHVLIALYGSVKRGQEKFTRVNSICNSWLGFDDHVLNLSPQIRFITRYCASYRLLNHTAVKNRCCVGVHWFNACSQLIQLYRFDMLIGVFVPVGQGREPTLASAR